MVQPPSRLKSGNWKNKCVLGYCGVCWLWKLDVRRRGTTPSKQQSVFRCQACPLRLLRHTCITTRRHGRWNAVFDRWTSGSSRDARRARVSHCGPKSPENFVDWSVHPSSGYLARPFRTLNWGHAPCTRGPSSVLVEAQLRSASLWRTRGPQRGSVQTIASHASFTSENWPRSCAGSNIRSLALLCCAFGLCASLSLGHTRGGGRISYVSCAMCTKWQAYQARKTSLAASSPHPRLPCIAQTLAPLRKPRACESMCACKRVGQ